MQTPWTLRLIANVYRGIKIRRRIRKVPRYRLAEFPEDTLGRAVGRVRPLDKRVLEAPLSGRLCVYYAIEVDVIGTTLGVEQLVAENLGVAFTLDDGSQHAVIDPNAAQVMCMFDHRSEVVVQSDVNARQRAVFDPAIYEWSSTMRVRYREAIIEVDEVIVVLGAGTREPDRDTPSDGTYRDTGRTRLHFTGSARHQLEITDDPAART